jgi:hypothetical protein
MHKILVSLIVALGVTTAQAAEPAKGAEAGKPAKAATASSAAPAAGAAAPASAAGTAKVGEPAKAADNSVCHDKVKDGKPVMKDGKPEQECKKIKVHKKLEAHDIPPAKK